LYLRVLFINSKTKLRYQGYTKTPNVFLERSPIGIDIFNFQHSEKLINSEDSKFENPRLGKLVEAYIFNDLKQQNSITWVCGNLQIKKDKLTIGELDAIFYDNDQPIHLEIVYKFYLYDTLNETDNPLDNWIGPNRKDFLVYKLNKLEQKQFPLLFDNKTKPYLESLWLNANSIQQKISFKAQLFLPFAQMEIDVNPLNKACVTGFYLSIDKIEILKNSQFYIPNKLDWLIIPHNNVKWLNFKCAIPQIKAFTDNKRSPMCWVKNETSHLQKCFITWW